MGGTQGHLVDRADMGQQVQQIQKCWLAENGVTIGRDSVMSKTNMPADKSPSIRNIDCPLHVHVSSKMQEVHCSNYGDRQLAVATAPRIPCVSQRAYMS